jgi:hypothetical protein
MVCVQHTEAFVWRGVCAAGAWLLRKLAQPCLGAKQRNMSVCLSVCLGRRSSSREGRFPIANGGLIGLTDLGLAVPLRDM